MNSILRYRPQFTPTTTALLKYLDKRASQDFLFEILWNTAKIMAYFNYTPKQYFAELNRRVSENWVYRNGLSYIEGEMIFQKFYNDLEFLKKQSDSQTD